jgi:transcriptional regulator with XRE-family HTH domain
MHMSVSKRKIPLPKQRFNPTFLKAWRAHKRLSQEKAGVRDRTQVGRIERGEQPYTQDTLEALAEVYGVQPWQLLMQDPEDKSWAQRFLFEMDPKARDELIEAAKRFRK